MESFGWETLQRSLTDLGAEIVASSAALQALLLGLAGVMIAFVVLFAVALSRARSLRDLRGAEIYRYLAYRLGLTRSELQLADRISAFYRPPEKRYMVLVEELEFEDCVLRAGERATLEEITLSALRLKLDFGAGKPSEIPASSSVLAAGTPLIMVQKGRSSIRGKVGEREEGALRVSLGPGVEPPTLGVPISVYFNTPAGMFVFATFARQLVDTDIYLDHSEVIRPTQRRKHYRKSIKLPVYIMLRDKLEEPIRSSIVDLSGGGASLRNPDMNVSPGDDLALSFSPGGERFTVPARVVRLSTDGRIIHVQFQRLSEAARDRLIGSLFKAKEQSVGP
jgi:hypothetical protein